MRAGQSLSQLTSQLLLRLESHFQNDKPELILAHGDTTTCFATAISSFYHQIPFFHVEAGLRTHRLNSPFPEEFNRQSIAPIALHHFAPTPLEKENLLRDGILASSITVTGSTVHDALRTMLPSVGAAFKNTFDASTVSRPTVVVTLHRREATQSLHNTLRGVKTAALKRPDAIFICPVHPSPLVQEAFRSVLSGHENIILTEPLEYPEFVSLLLRARLVITDSGGVQEEASFLGKQVLLARSETERSDGLNSGLVKMIGIKADSVCKSVLSELSSSRMNQSFNLENKTQPTASQIICDEVKRVVG